MPAYSINQFSHINQSSGVKHRADIRPPADAAQGPGMGFETVFRDVHRSATGQDIAAADGKKMPTGDVQRYSLGPRVNIITSRNPPPDEQSLLAFAKAQGIDQAVLDLIMAKKDAPTGSADSSASDPAAAAGAADLTQALALSGLAQAAIGVTPVPIRAPVAQTDVLAAACALKAAAGAGLAPGSPVASDQLAARAIGTAPVVTAAASDQGRSAAHQVNTGALGKAALATDPLALAGIPAPTGTGAAAVPAVPISDDTRAVLGSKALSGQSKPDQSTPDQSKPLDNAAVAPGLPPASAAVPNSIRAGIASEAQSGHSGPMVDLRAAPESVVSVASPAGMAPAAPGSPSDSAATAAIPAALAVATAEDKTPTDAALTNADDGSPPAAELLENGTTPGQQAAQKGILYGGPAMQARQDGQKAGKSRSEAGQSATVRQIDAAALAPGQMHAVLEDVRDSVSAAASANPSRPDGGSAQTLDLGTAAPAHEESLQDAYFRRSEQYQLLSDRVSEAIGQRLSAQIARGAWQVSLQLSPAHLGKIDIRLGMSGNGTIDAEFKTSQQHTKDLLLNGLPRLKEVMAQSGIDLASMNVRHEGASANGGNPPPRHSQLAANPVALPDHQEPAAELASRTARIGADGLDVMV